MHHKSRSSITALRPVANLTLNLLRDLTKPRMAPPVEGGE